MPRSDILAEEPLSLFQIIGPSSSTCGYCSPPGSGRRSAQKSSKSFGIWAHQLSCSTYKTLIDRGWRRSGSYVYKPDMRGTCCPQYTIRLKASEFKPSKSQRNLLNKFNDFVVHGGKEGTDGFGPALSDPSCSASVSADVMQEPPASKNAGKSKAKGKGRNNQEYNLVDSLHSVEQGSCREAAHKLEVTIEPASFTAEKYGLYKKYQMRVHGDKESKVTEKGFTRFLCDSPLELAKSPFPDLPYGSHHQLYRLDGALIAISVLDILPGAVSGVYFIYDPDWQGLSLGKISALREAALSRELQEKGGIEMWYMMGYYIHTCQKMKYKAEYKPSYLLDPETYEFHGFEDVCRPMLDRDDHAVFSEYLSGNKTLPPVRDKMEDDPPGGNAKKGNAPSGPAELSGTTRLDEAADSEEEEEEEDEDEIYGFDRGTALPLLATKNWKSAATQKKLREGIAALGAAAIGACLFA